MLHHFVCAFSSVVLYKPQLLIGLDVRFFLLPLDKKPFSRLYGSPRSVVQVSTQNFNLLLFFFIIYYFFFRLDAEINFKFPRNAI